MPRPCPSLVGGRKSISLHGFSFRASVVRTATAVASGSGAGAEVAGGAYGVPAVGIAQAGDEVAQVARDARVERGVDGAPRAFPGIRISAVEPGCTATDLNQQTDHQIVAGDAEIIAWMAQVVPDRPTGGCIRRGGDAVPVGGQRWHSCTGAAGAGRLSGLPSASADVPSG